MGMASHLGPWLLGTVKNSVDSVSATNAAAGKNRNMGVTIVTQSFSISGTGGAVAGGATNIVLPAGSMIVQMNLLISTAFDGSATLDLLLNGSSITNSPAITTAGTNVTVNAGANATKVGLWQNTGSVDKVLTYTTATGTTITTGAAVVVVVYAVRNADGSTAPTASQV